MVLVAGIEIPLIVFWIVGISFSLIIYLFVFSDEKKDIAKQFMKKFGFWIVFILLWISCNNFFGVWNYNAPIGSFFSRRATTIFLFLFFIINIFKLLIWFIRYIEVQAICDNRSGACARYVQRGRYIILSIGSTDWFDFGHESWVVPIKHFNKINNKPNSSKTQIEIKTRVTRSDIEEIPKEAFDFFEMEAEADGFNKENIYYGEYSLRDIEENNRINDKKGNKLSLLDIKNINRQDNETQRMLSSKLKLRKEFFSAINTIRKKASGEQTYKPTDKSQVQE